MLNYIYVEIVKSNLVLSSMVVGNFVPPNIEFCTYIQPKFSNYFLFKAQEFHILDLGITIAT